MFTPTHIHTYTHTRAYGRTYLFSHAYYDKKEYTLDRNNLLLTWIELPWTFQRKKTTFFLFFFQMSILLIMDEHIFTDFFMLDLKEISTN